jgi:hypothetical protein
MKHRLCCICTSHFRGVEVVFEGRLLDVCIRVRCTSSVRHQQIHCNHLHFSPSPPHLTLSADCSQPISDNFGNFVHFYCPLLKSLRLAPCILQNIMLSIKYLLEQRRLGHLYKLCNPSFHEFRVIPSANEFQLVCYTATLFTTEAECKRVNLDWHLAHLRRRRAMICLTRIATGPLIPIGNEGREIHTPPPHHPLFFCGK